MSKPKLAPCPWCKKKPEYIEVKWNCNYDSHGNRYDDVIPRPTEKISCNNLECTVRPELIRIQTFDAIQLWNSYE